MKLIKYTQYVYLVFAIFFIYDAVSKLLANEEGYTLSFIIAAVCIFMFFFRRSFVKRFENHKKGN